MKPKGPVFIVGNSRSGTTLVSKILGLHPLINSFQELHFFEHLWHPTEKDVTLNSQDAIGLGARLIATARTGRLAGDNSGRFLDESAGMLGDISGKRLLPATVYTRFLEYECGRNNKSIPCEQTPRYVFYIGEIFTIFPNARIISMVRDPRDILLSQKNKWKQYRAARGWAYKKELVRSWGNYHPVLLSRMWRQAIRASEKYLDDPRVNLVRFEDLTQRPGIIASEICQFVGVDFQERMLNVASSKSVLAIDDVANSGISAAPVGRWRSGLKNIDVYWCQKLAGDEMVSLGYHRKDVPINPFTLAFSLLMLPLKLILALFLNLGQSKKLIRSIRTRFFAN